MKKEYLEPKFEVTRIMMEDVCSQVIHASFEEGGQNSGWDWNDDDEDFGG